MTVTLRKREVLPPAALLLLTKEFMKLPSPEQKRKWKGLLSAIRRNANTVASASKSKKEVPHLAPVCRKLHALLNLLDRRLERDLAK